MNPTNNEKRDTVKYSDPIISYRTNNQKMMETKKTNRGNKNETSPFSLPQCLMIKNSDPIKDLGLYHEVGEELLELAKSIPYLGLCLNSLKAISSFSDALLFKKLVKFLQAVSDRGMVGPDLKKFLDSLEDRERVYINEELLLVVEKLESFEKAKIAGKLLVAYARNFLDFEEFQSCIQAILGINSSNIPMLLGFYRNNQKLDPESLAYHFANLGLISVSSNMIGTIGGGGPSYEQNSLGKKFVESI